MRTNLIHYQCVSAAAALRTVVAQQHRATLNDQCRPSLRLLLLLCCSEVVAKNFYRCLLVIYSEIIIFQIKRSEA